MTIEFGHAKHGIEPYQWTSSGTDSATAWVGEPLLEWTLGDLANATWISSAYDVMKRFLAIARREYELLNLGQCSQLIWTKNDKESIRSSFKMIKSKPTDLQSVAQQIFPGMRALMLQAMALPEEPRNQLMIPLIALAAALRNHGVDVQPSNMFANMWALASRDSHKSRKRIKQKKLNQQVLDIL